MVTNKGVSLINLPHKIKLRDVRVVQSEDSQVTFSASPMESKNTTATKQMAPEYLKSTIFFETQHQATGAYLLECDKEYNPFQSGCFHIKLSWIFGTSL